MGFVFAKKAAQIVVHVKEPFIVHKKEQNRYDRKSLTTKLPMEYICILFTIFCQCFWNLDI